MQVQAGRGIMDIPVQMIDAVGVEGACPPDEAVDFVSLFQQKFR
jgi:hypothetical protein